MRKMSVLLSAAALLGLTATSALADDKALNLSINTPHWSFGYSDHAPYPYSYVPRSRSYYAPPVYYAPRPYYRRPPAYYDAPPVVHVRPRHYHRHHGHWRHHDGWRYYDRRW